MSNEDSPPTPPGVFIDPATGKIRVVIREVLAWLELPHTPENEARVECFILGILIQRGKPFRVEHLEELSPEERQ